MHNYHLEDAWLYLIDFYFKYNVLTFGTCSLAVSCHVQFSITSTKLITLNNGTVSAQIYKLVSLHCNTFKRIYAALITIPCKQLSYSSINKEIMKSQTNSCFVHERKTNLILPVLMLRVTRIHRQAS